MKITIADVNALQTSLDAKASSGDLTTALAQKIDASEKGAANGLATLGSDSKIPTSQLPALALTDVHVVASQAAMVALVAEEGDVAIRTDLNKSFIHNGGASGTVADWTELLSPTDLVTSVNGQQGAVTLTASNITSTAVGNISATNIQAALAELDSEKAPTLHSHAWGSITGTLADQTDLATALAGKASTSHNHDATYAALSHIHAIADVTGLSSALADKANTIHVHAIADVTGLIDALAGKSDVGHHHDSTYAPLSHGHAISEVTGLQPALDGKLNLTGGTLTTGYGDSYTRFGSNVLGSGFDGIQMQGYYDYGAGGSWGSYIDNGGAFYLRNASAGAALFMNSTSVHLRGTHVYIQNTAGTVNYLHFNETTGLAVTGSGNFTGALSASNLSGTNTGDQTNITGNAGTATTLATGRTISMTGDVAWTSPAFNGSANVTAAGTIQAGMVTNAKLADMPTATFKGRTAAGTGVPEDLTATQATALLNNFTTGLKGLVPAPITSLGRFLKDDGTWDTVAQGTWGSITGNLSNQTDLQDALDAKASLDSPSFTGTPTVASSAIFHEGNLSFGQGLTFSGGVLTSESTDTGWETTVKAVGTGAPQNITIPETGLQTQDVLVFVDGIRWESNEYNIIGNTLTLTTSAPGDSIEIIKPSGAAGAPGAGWVLVTAWDFAQHGAVSTVEAEVAGATDVLLVARNVTSSSSVQRAVQVSTDGTNWFSTSGNYNELSTAGVEASNAAMFPHATAATAARSVAVMLHNVSETSTQKVALLYPRAAHAQFVGSSEAIQKIRLMGSSGAGGAPTGNFNGGSVRIYTRRGGSAGAGGAGGTAEWGQITGTLANQSDLQAALALKANDTAVVKLSGNQTITGTKTFAALVASQITTTSNTSGTNWSLSGQFDSYLRGQNYRIEYSSGVLHHGNDAGILLGSTGVSGSPLLRLSDSNASGTMYLGETNNVSGGGGTLFLKVQGYDILKLRKGDNRHGSAIISSIPTDETYNNASLLVRNRWDGAPAAVFAKLAATTSEDILQVTDETFAAKFLSVGANGNIGVGTTGAQSLLHLKSVAPIIRMEGAGSPTVGLDFYSGASRISGITHDMNSGEFKIGNTGGNGHYITLLAGNGSETARITGTGLSVSGKLSANASLGSNDFTVAGGIEFSGNAFAGSGTGIWQPTNGELGFVASGNTIARVSSTGVGVTGDVNITGTYRVNGVPIGTGGGGGSWGSITGTLSDQTDLQTALNGKANLTGGNTFAGSQLVQNGDVECIGGVLASSGNGGPLNQGTIMLGFTGGGDTAAGANNGLYVSSGSGDAEYYCDAHSFTNWWGDFQHALFNNAGVSLYALNVKRLETTSTGVNVTGALTQNGVQVSLVGHVHPDVVAGGASGFMSGTDKTKLDGIATGATANSTDAYLLSRANHTGTQDQSTITNLITDLAAKANTTDVVLLTGNQTIAGTKTFSSTITGSVSGNAGTATTLATGRTIGMTGDVSWTSASFNGSGNVTGTSTIEPGAVSLSKLASLAANSIIGNNTGSSATPVALTAAQVTAMLSIFTTGQKGLVPASGGGTTNFLRADGTWAAPPAGEGGGGGTPSTSWGSSVYAVGTGVEQTVILPESGLQPFEVLVFVDGLRWQSDEYTISGNALTLTTNEAGTSIEIVKPTGSNGVGIASGGTTGQILAKASDSDFDTAWITPAGGGGAVMWGSVLGTLSDQTDLKEQLDRDILRSDFTNLQLGAGSAGNAPTFDGEAATIIHTASSNSDAWWHSVAPKSGDFVLEFERLTANDGDDCFLWFSSDPATGPVPVEQAHFEPYYGHLYAYHGGTTSRTFDSVLLEAYAVNGAKLFFVRRGTELEVWSGNSVNTAVYLKSFAVPSGALYVNYTSGGTGLIADIKLSFYTAVIPSLVDAIRKPDKEIGTAISKKMDILQGYSKGSLTSYRFDYTTNEVDWNSFAGFDCWPEDVMTIKVRNTYPFRWAIGRVVGTRVSFDVDAGYTGFQFNANPFVGTNVIYHAGNLVDATGSTAGLMSSTDKTKLDGVATGATANATDSQLRDRATHTGTQAISTVTGLQTALDGKQAAGSYAAASHTHAQSDITNLVTDLAGKLDTSHAGTGGTAHANVIAGGAAGFMTGTDKTKLDGVATGATLNATDAQLRDRATHTGSQAQSTIANLTTDLAAKANTTDVVALTGNQTIAGTKTFSSTITGSVSGNAGTATTLATPRAINGTNFDGSAPITITAANPNAVTFNNAGTGAASGSTYTGGAVLTVSHNTIGAAPISHTHAIADVTNLQTTLNAKLDTSAYVAPVRSLSVFCSGKPANNEVIGGGIAPYAFTITSANCVVRSVVAATGSVVFSIRKNGTQVGTATFPTSGTVATLSFSDTTVAQGDQITITAPADASNAPADITALIRE
jgi:hypothetical protein